MLPTARKIDLYVKWSQSSINTGLYLSERLNEITRNEEPDKNELRKTYYEAKNISLLLKEQFSDLNDNIYEAGKLARELL